MPRTDPILTWDQLAAARDVPRPARALLDSIVAELRPPSGDGPADGTDERWLLTELSVEGFVGIGTPAIVLPVHPKPGLTVVTAPNGSGKSSLALALRHLLGGAAASEAIDPSLRIRWQNIRTPSFRLGAAFVDEASGNRAFLTDTGHGAGPRFTRDGTSHQSLPETWTAAKSRFEPVLIYPEVATAMSNEGRVNDAWFKALSLDVLNTVYDHVHGKRAEATKLRNELIQAYKKLDEFELDDELVDELPERVERLDAETVARIRAILEDLRARYRDARAYCPPLSPRLEECLARFYDACERLAHSPGGDDARGEILRSLYREALQLHLGVDDRCPLCGSTDRDWRDDATRRLAELDDRHSGGTVERLDVARTDLARALPTYPGGADTRLPGRLAERFRELDESWDAIRATLADLRPQDLELRTVQRLRTAIRNAVLEHRGVEHDVREYLAPDPKEFARQQLNGFLQEWTRSGESIATYESADSLLGWLRTQRQNARDVLTGELSDQARAIFRRLCPEGRLELTEYATAGGTEQRQKMSATIRLDGADDTGGTEMLSTGQLNALCLSAFLPRTMRPANPFGFIVLDDPIQAFDGGRIHHLIEILHEAAENYQVIVFTHDERLPLALRESGTPFDHHALTNSNGQLGIERIETPATKLLADARLVANENLPDPASDAALAIATLALGRQAIDDALSACNDVLNYVKSEPSKELKGKTTKQRLANLNDRLRKEQRQEIPRDDELFEAMNNAAHGYPPADRDRNSRNELTRRAKDLVDVIEQTASGLR